MTLTGRAGLLAATGGLVIAVFGTGIASLIVNAVILAALAADLLFAASIAGLRVSRSGDAKIGLGQTGSTALTVINSGRRRLRGVVRDGWRPSAAARPGRSRIDLPAGRRAILTTTLTPERRGDVAASARWAWPGASGVSPPRSRSGCCRHSCPASTCRPSWPGSANSTASTGR